MISTGSLSAFSASGATQPLSRPQAPSSPRPHGLGERVRSQSSGASGGTQAAPQALLPASPDKKLPRGSLLNLQV